MVEDRLVFVKSPVSREGRISRVVPAPLGVWTWVVSEVNSVPPVSVSPVKAPAPTQTPVRPHTVPLGQSASVEQAVVEVQIPDTHTGAPAGHCALFVQSAALNTAGLAVHEAEVPV